ncbi:MAG: type I 3-dehydroquinate dehydratase [Candidatus Peregrinibacteria bacterium]
MALRVCVPIVPTSLSHLLESMKKAAPKADILELWMGELSPEERFYDVIFALKKQLQIPVLITIKGEEEKGHFTGTAEEKVEILLECAQRGAEYIDIDYEFSPKLLQKIQGNKGETKIILSAHFFRGTPSLPALLSRVEKMKERGADMVKIAAFAEDPRDLITILRLAENLKRSETPFIAIAMGDIGKPSRLLTPFLGGEMSFAPLEISQSSAPGQIPVDALRAAWNTVKMD